MEVDFGRDVPLMILSLVFGVIVCSDVVYPVLYSIFLRSSLLQQFDEFPLRLSIFRAHAKLRPYCLCLPFLQAKAPNYSATLKKIFSNLEQIDSDMLT
jgi:hypothetical protein